MNDPTYTFPASEYNSRLDQPSIKNLTTEEEIKKAYRDLRVAEAAGVLAIDEFIKTGFCLIARNFDLQSGESSLEFLESLFKSNEYKNLFNQGYEYSNQSTASMPSKVKLMHAAFNKIDRKPIYPVFARNIFGDNNMMEAKVSWKILEDDLKNAGILNENNFLVEENNQLAALVFLTRLSGQAYSHLHLELEKFFDPNTKIFPPTRNEEFWKHKLLGNKDKPGIAFYLGYIKLINEQIKTILDNEFPEAQSELRGAVNIAFYASIDTESAKTETKTFRQNFLKALTLKRTDLAILYARCYLVRNSENVKPRVFDSLGINTDNFDYFHQLSRSLQALYDKSIAEAVKRETQRYLDNTEVNRLNSVIEQYRQKQPFFRHIPDGDSLKKSIEIILFLDSTLQRIPIFYWEFEEIGQHQLPNYKMQKCLVSMIRYQALKINSNVVDDICRKGTLSRFDPDETSYTFPIFNMSEGLVLPTEIKILLERTYRIQDLKLESPILVAQNPGEYALSLNKSQLKALQRKFDFLDPSVFFTQEE